LLRRLSSVFFAAMVVGSLSPLTVLALSPTFHILLTPARVVVAQGASPVALTFWNDGSESLPVTITTSKPWLTVFPTTFVAPAGSHQQVTVTMAPEGKGKAYVIFAVDAGADGNVRVSRALAATFYVGVPAPLSPSVATKSPLSVPWALIGFLLALAGLVVIVWTLRRRVSIQWR
jgi:hypothetical protein